MNGWSRILPIDEKADFLAAACLVARPVGDVQIVADDISSAREFLSMLSDGVDVCGMTEGWKRHRPDQNLLQCCSRH